MKCEEIQKRLLDVEWGELNLEETKEVQEHLLDCPRCYQYEKDLKRLLKLMRNVEEREPSLRPYLFLKSRVEEFGERERSRRMERILSLFRRPIPLYQAILVSFGLVFFAWIGGSLTGREGDQEIEASQPSREASIEGVSHLPDTQISFVSTPTVWTRVYPPDTLPGQSNPF